MHPKESKPTPEALLQLSDQERRRYAGQKFDDWLNNKGFDASAYLGNCLDALPPVARPAMTAHGVPTSAYHGRTLGMSLAMLPERACIVVLEEPLLESEMSFWRSLCESASIPFPNTVEDPSCIPGRPFIYPFIGSQRLLESYGEQTIPPAERFNDKAEMRVLMRQLGLADHIVPGTELFYRNENPTKFTDRIANAVRDQIAEQNTFLKVKLGRSASGLLTIGVTPEMALNDSELKKALTNMQTPSLGSKMQPENVVIERHMDFGKHKEGLGDFSLRGVLTPQGEFIALSVGRVISNEKGEYFGMVMVQSSQTNELETIGLHRKTFISACTIFSKLANAIYERGYFGPVSIDFFAGQNSQDPTILVHDYNMREGGTTISGLVSSLSEVTLGEPQPILDIQVKLKPDAPLNEETLNAMVQSLHDQQIFGYATNFFQYPHEGIYSLKVMRPYKGEALTDAQVAEKVASLIDNLNQNVSLGGINFRSPL